MYKQTLRSDGVVGLYRGFVPSVVGICVYRGLQYVIKFLLLTFSEDATFRSSFGGYDTIKDTFLVGPLQGNFFAAFAVGWLSTTVFVSFFF